MSSADYVNYPRLGREFFCRDVLVVAPELIGKSLVRSIEGRTFSHIITETEAYRGEEDQASHARFGQTARNRIMYEQGGFVYVYKIYGIHWMLNVVTAPRGIPQAILIRGLRDFPGPGLVTRELGIDKSFYGEDLAVSGRIWIENDPGKPSLLQTPRVGISYAGEPWKSNLWRYMIETG